MLLLASPCKGTAGAVILFARFDCEGELAHVIQTLRQECWADKSSFMLAFSNSKTPMQLENAYERCGCRCVWLCCWSMLESEGCGTNVGSLVVFTSSSSTLPRHHHQEFYLVKDQPHFCACYCFRLGNKKGLLRSPWWAERVQMAIKEPLTALGFSFSDGDSGIQATSRMGALSLLSWSHRAHELGTDIVVQGLRRRLPPPPSLRFGAGCGCLVGVHCGRVKRKT
jgi:hypothetical protein